MIGAADIKIEDVHSEADQIEVYHLNHKYHLTRGPFSHRA